MEDSVPLFFPEQIRWRCRRGMLECDLFLIAFFDACFSELTVAEKTAFVSLLDSPDPELFSWLMGNSMPNDKNLVHIVEKIRCFQFNQQEAIEEPGIS